MARLKIGDRVRIKNAASGYRGRTGTITGVSHTSADEPVNQQEAIELFRSYAVEFDGGQIELVVGQDLEAE